MPNAFLSCFLPDLIPSAEGAPRQCYFAFGKHPERGYLRQVKCYSHEELIATCRKMVQDGMDTYYAQASYADDRYGRLKENVAGLRTFWLDIDVGKKENAYASFDEACAGLARFITETGLKPACVVSSGKGLYAYWLMDRVLTPKEWLVLACWLEQVVIKQGLIADPACTTNANRVLRMPGTKHTRSGNTVTVLSFNAERTLTPDQFIEQLASYAPFDQTAFERRRRTVKPLPSMVPANVALDPDLCFASPSVPEADARVIAEHCQQVADGGLGSEPQWHAMLSVLRCCKNGQEWAHTLSARDADRYVYEQTEQKFYATQENVPATCDHFYLQNPEICERCKYRGQIKSPVQLWRRIGGSVQEAPAEVSAAEPVQAPAADVAHLDLPPVFTYQPKSFTSPDYYVDTDGCHWLEHVKKKSGEWETTNHLITHSQMYYLKTVWTYKNGKSQRDHWFLVVNPNGHREQVSLDASIASSAQSLMAWLYSSNIFPANINYTAKVFMGFINAYLNSVLNQSALEEVSTSETFGWKQADTASGQAEGFAIGTGLITEDGMVAQEYTGVASKLSKALGAAGTLDGWKPVAQMYKTLDQKAAQLGICLSLAAPFMKYGSGVATSATYSLWSTQSGLGKTQLLRAAASVWGNPDAQFIQRNASAVARMRQLAVLNNLPAFMDELTDVSDEDLYSLAYSLVGGQEKNKLKRNGVEMMDTGTWSTVTFITSNKSIKEAVARCSGDSSASVTRVIEYECDFQSYANDARMTEYINACIGACMTNYGIAGPTLVYNALKHSDRLRGLTAQLEHWVTSKGFANEERFMAFPLAIALKIGRWAVEWGIIDYDMDALEKWVLEVFVEHNRQRTAEQEKSPRHILLSYLVERQRNLLQVTEDVRTDAVPPPSMPDPYIRILPAHADTLLRMTVKENRLYIVKSDFDKWCKRQGFSIGNLWRQLRGYGIEYAVAYYNLGAGTSSVQTPTAPCYVLESASVTRLGYSPEETLSQPNGSNVVARPFK